jgi:hypothetical protein
MDRTKVFVSYSQRDWTWLGRLKVHLAILQRSNDQIDQITSGNYNELMSSSFPRSDLAEILASITAGIDPFLTKWAQVSLNELSANHTYQPVEDPLKIRLNN